MATVAQWQQVQDLFHAALEKEPAERLVFLDNACGGNESLRQEVAWLISAHETEDHFIDSPGYVAARDVLATHHFEPDEMLAHYKIQAALGEGGMGVVYLAEDTRLKRKVALKILPPHFTLNPDRVRRFEREARAASALSHPNIVTIYEIGESDTTHFIATEFVDGKTLRQLINEKPFTLNETLNVSMQVADALNAAHVAGIVHRDIKPENIMIRQDGYVKILDFGLAKLTEQQTSDADLETPTLLQSNPGLVMGTAHYMSPEQARGENVGVGTDIWSLGIVMYELLAGHIPFTGETSSHVMVSLMEDKLPPLKDHANVPDDLDQFVTKALRKNQRDRYQTAGQLARELKNFKQTLQQDSRLKEFLKTVPNNKDGVSLPPVTPLSTVSGAHRVPLETRAAAETSPLQLHPTSSAEYLVSEIKHQKRGVLLAAAALVIAVIIVGYFYVTRSRFTAASEPIKSIAVLPFVNVNNDPNAEYLSDGLAGNLIGSLSKVPGLEVKALSTVVRYKGANSDARRIGQELNVEAVVFARLVQTGEDLTLEVELVDSRNENSFWRRTYKKKKSDLVVLQSELARDLFGKLSVPITDKTQEKLAKRDTENSEAYLLYLRGVNHARKITAQDINQAIEFFSQAIQKDPEYAKAYAALASAHRSLTLCCDGQPSELLQAKLAAQKAVDLDDELAEGHSALAAVIWMYDWKWAEAEREFQRALELDPNSAIVHFQYGDFLGRMGRSEEAAAQKDRAAELEPYEPFFAARVGSSLDPEKSLKQILYAIDLNPNFYFSHIMAASVYGQRKEYGKAIEAARLAKKLSPDQTWSDANLSSIFVNAGRPEEARAILDQLLLRSKSRFVPPYHIAMVYNNLGDKERALYWLEKAYDIRDGKMAFLKTMPWKNVRDDPRFQDILRRVGFVAAK